MVRKIRCRPFWHIFYIQLWTTITQVMSITSRNSKTWETFCGLLYMACTKYFYTIFLPYLDYRGERSKWQTPLGLISHVPCVWLHPRWHGKVQWGQHLVHVCRCQQPDSTLVFTLHTVPKYVVMHVKMSAQCRNNGQHNAVLSDTTNKLVRLLENTVY